MRGDVRRSTRREVGIAQLRFVTVQTAGEMPEAALGKFLTKSERAISGCNAGLER
jgi:hypothetical protein